MRAQPRSVARENLLPSIALRLCPDDRAALRDYLAFYRFHASQGAASAGFPFLDAELCRNLLKDHWEPYLRELREQATIGAGAGIDYVEWFDVAARHRRDMLAALSALPNVAPDRRGALIRGMGR